MIPRILQFHEDPGCLAFVQTAAGRFLIWIAGMALIVYHDVNALMPVAFTLVLIVPAQRRWLLMLVSFGLIVGTFLPNGVFEFSRLLEGAVSIGNAQWLEFLFSATVATAFILGIITAAIRFDRLPEYVRQHPLLILNLLVLCALTLGSIKSFEALALAPFVLWRASYLFKSAAAHRTAATSVKDHLFYMVPVFGGTNTPFGKGPDYLSRSEAVNPESVARSQLAGIKLLGLAVVWKVARALMDTAIFGHTNTFLAHSLASWSLNLPSMTQLLRTAANPPAVTGWLSVYLDLVRTILSLAIWGHVIVGCLRLLGFNVFRNTYKPLFARSIVEFWNRFFYYFKELLVDFFFYPAFYRSAWAGPKLRLFLAIFAAAFVGNIYFHLVREYELVFAGDTAALLTFWYPRLIYCSLLVLGIWLSMLRQQELRKLPARANGLLKFRAIAGVWTFYGLLHVWLVAPYGVGVARRIDFLASLLGL